MAAYRRVDGLVTCELTACTPGSAPGPTLGNKYGKILPFTELMEFETVSRFQFTQETVVTQLTSFSSELIGS